MTVNNHPMKPGYIFIPCERLVEGMSVQRMGGMGFYAKLDAESCNGWFSITVREYNKVPIPKNNSKKT